MKGLNKFIQANKQCPFLYNHFKIDVSRNQIASDFLKKFVNLCPHLKNANKMNEREASGQTVSACASTNTTTHVAAAASFFSKCPINHSKLLGKKEKCTGCPHNACLHSNEAPLLNEITEKTLQESSQKCPFVGLLNIDNSTETAASKLLKNQEEYEQSVKKNFIMKNKSIQLDNQETSEKELNEYDQQFANAIKGLKTEGRYRVFNHIKKIAGRFPKALYTDSATNETKEITVWCSNDYLGMGQHPTVRQAMIDAVKETGVGAGGTRNIGGSSIYHTQLESELADLHFKEKAIVMSSGFVANQGAINALTKVLKDVIYLSDEKNHASIIEGIRNSKADKVVWKHNDMEDLENKLKQLPLERNKIIIFESVYSMSGTISPIGEVCKLAKKYNALTFIDEVHAIGLYGKRGGGVAEMMGLMDQIDIFSGTLGKAYGCVGGYIAGNSLLIDCIRSFAQNFIFTTSIPPCIAQAAKTSIAYVKEHNELRERLHFIARLIKKRCNDKNIPILPNESHIIPVFIGDAKKAKMASDLLMQKYDIYVQPINYPTVPKGQELLRISPTPNHNEDMVEKLVLALEGVFEELQLRENFGQELSHNFTEPLSLAEKLIITA
ncbi:5-aminolevulinate synthase (macronuclear) [Tetrahymena thermophila SB210]|uniref:5-aminolevulinate synthase n=1 Tax=Tetrahymena thermophila (strain SB210) TaxID=312017 RepID=Q22CW9_TETTS|nr:5-aminolevulinate synthase [Tetrahymena thermophila SB210]EAR83150.1 5-aminolevulinate synthase [Tetrahymena thermophila SB210]|eukprot:XP_001030813.1 5-aminolevulinate synthase [Tetrahymena thermophila SB210]